jgi:phosphoglycolate phosphatase
MRVVRLRAVVTDLDNTLYPWVDYVVPCLEAMVSSLAATTGLPRIRIVQSLKAVYTKYESNEYPFAIQESDLFAPYEGDPDSFLQLVVEPARRAFRDAREKYLQPYPGVPGTLEEIRRRGYALVALTDAPRNAAELRLKWLGLDQHFDAIYTLPGYPLPRHVHADIRRRQEAGHYRGRTRVIELPREAEKPSPAGLRRVLADLGVRGDEVLYVGDNLAKDMPLAAACGALGAWAEYGTYVSPEYRERLAVISAQAVTRRHVPDDVARGRPSTGRWPLAISSFVQVLDLLDGARWAPGITGPARRAGRRPGPRAPSPRAGASGRRAGGSGPRARGRPRRR